MPIRFYNDSDVGYDIDWCSDLVEEEIEEIKEKDEKVSEKV